jgi:D-alanyl-D-alanine carboxypeptidase
MKKKEDQIRTERNYITFIRRSDNPEHITEHHEDREESDFRRISRLKIAGGIIAFAGLAVGVYLTVVFWFLPYLSAHSIYRETASSSTESAVSESSDEESTAIYDTATGLQVYDDSINLLLVNSENPVTSDNEPELAEVGGVSVDARIAPALEMLKEKAAEDGVALEFSSGFISYSEQEKLYNDKVNSLVSAGETKIMAAHDAQKTVTKPGEADEESGLSVTLSGSADTFTKSNVYNWLNNNMLTYGFTFRYPAEKSGYTGKDADYRVIRYVGHENAVKMRQLSLCLEEYVNYVKNK